MKNEAIKNYSAKPELHLYIQQESPIEASITQPRTTAAETALPRLLFICSYPPRVCGIATYSQDLIKSLTNSFGNTFSIDVCAIEAGLSGFKYPPEVKYVMNAQNASEYMKMARLINQNSSINLVVIQHEFGLYASQHEAFLQFMFELSKPVVLVFHTVLPAPNEALRKEVLSMASAARSLIVMTRHAQQILKIDYGIQEDKITIIPHGTHLVPYTDREILKKKFGFSGKKILSTFGLLGRGKNIETTLQALPGIIKKNPDVMFLIIGKTHPEIVKTEGEQYRDSLEEQIRQNDLSRYVKFVNQYVALPELLEYLQMTDIYLFTSNDPNQAVSGTFAYAMSCGCAIISTPIPHARELLAGECGIIIDFGHSVQLESAVNRLFQDKSLTIDIRNNSLEKITSTSWENSAIAHTHVFENTHSFKMVPRYNLPAINLKHIHHLTTDFGMIQFARINHPDQESGYTLDDNARALIAMIMHYELKETFTDLSFIRKFLSFIKYCQQDNGYFLNYVDKFKKFTPQNSVNLDDANGRAIWALGFAISKKSILPAKIISTASAMLNRTLPNLDKISSSRSLAFAIRGLYLAYNQQKSEELKLQLIRLADKLVQKYRQESTDNWRWFEDTLTYANSALSEAMLYAWQLTGSLHYKNIARISLDFLLSVTFRDMEMRVISNQGWMKKGQKSEESGEQPIDVGYTIYTLDRFYEAFQNKAYLKKMTIAFSWFLGNNRLRKIVYNPCTGGCFDGLEKDHVNINQGAESTLSYLIARLVMENYKQ